MLILNEEIEVRFFKFIVGMIGDDCGFKVLAELVEDGFDSIVRMGHLALGGDYVGEEGEDGFIDLMVF